MAAAEEPGTGPSKAPGPAGAAFFDPLAGADDKLLATGNAAGKRGDAAGGGAAFGARSCASYSALSFGSSRQRRAPAASFSNRCAGVASSPVDKVRK